ncbi:MAG TPA: DUF6493 family protein [Phycisphaerae bacterium]|nr:DUF6493 family protein [Phycisphaerae bacterium]HRW51873.1 DUF6493 family protein [Phycisphaerae bacterium]
MTPEQLEQFVARADADGLVSACASLEESERRRLSKFAATLYKEIDAARSKFDPETHKWISTRLDRLDRWLDETPPPRIHEQQAIAELAMLAVCPFSQTKNIGAMGWRDAYATPPAARLLSDRSPDWIDAWVEEKLKGEFKDIGWGALRCLIRAGVCKSPSVDGYIEHMASSAPGAWHRNDETPFVPLSQRLRDDPDLLNNELWRLFEVETVAFKYDYYSKKDNSDYETWPIALKRLVDEGVIDRDRLLDASLSGLTAGIRNNLLLSGFANFHEFLAPTLDERAARQRIYLELLAHQAPQVVTFALNALKELEKCGMLDASAFIRGVAPAMTCRQKAQPKTALTMLRKIAGAKDAPHGAIALAASEACSHEAADIHERAIRLIASIAKKLPDDVRPVIADRLAQVAPSCQAAANEVIASLGLNLETAPATTSEVPEGLKADLLDRAKAMDAKWRRLAGVDAAMEAIADDTFPPPLDLDSDDIPILSGVEAVQPIESLDELIQVVSHAVEAMDRVDDVERILDGISRLCDQKPDDFERVTGPLLKRINEGVSDMKGRSLVGHLLMTPTMLRVLLRAWLRKDASVPELHVTEEGVNAFWNARLSELVQRVAKEQSAPLLAAPTHTRGWIDPRIFVRRIESLAAGGMEAPRLDLIQGLLRLAPDHRAEALALAKSVKGRYARAIRWALGAADALTKKDADDGDIWIAAARGRRPRGPITELAVLSLPEDAPDVVDNPPFNWTSSHTRREQMSLVVTIPELSISSASKAKSEVDNECYPLIALHRNSDRWSYYDTNTAWHFEWLGHIWPANADAIMVAAIQSMMLRIDDPPSNFEPNHALLQTLFQVDLPISEIAIVAAWIALVSRDADCRGVVIDALIEAIHDGRCDSQSFGDVLARITDGGWIKLNRVRDALAEIARLSPLHALVVSQILDEWVSRQSALPRDAHAITGLLLETNTQLAVPLRDASRTVLSGVRGSGKSAKAAKQLLAIDGKSPSAARKEALLLALQGRIERGERWGAPSDGFDDSSASS